MKFKILTEEINIINGTFIDNNTFKDKYGNNVPLVKTDLRQLAKNQEDNSELKSAEDLEDYDDSDTWFTPEDIDDYESEDDGLNRINRGEDGVGDLNNTDGKGKKNKTIIIVDDTTGKQYTYNNGYLEEF